MAQIQNKIFKVGLLLQMSQAHMRGVIKGVYNFLADNQHWELTGEGHYPLLNWDHLSDWQGDGIITMINSDSQLNTLLKLKVPILNTGSRFTHEKLPSVFTDNYSIGQLAAQHLLKKNIQNFLFVGELTWENGQQRLLGAKETIKNAGYKLEVFSDEIHSYINPDASPHYLPSINRLTEKLKQLDNPIGVITPDAVSAKMVITLAKQANLKVPSQVAVIGVNDDTIVCESSSPPLSAVNQPSEIIGQQAAQRLNQLMLGKTITPWQLKIKATKITPRESTDLQGSKNKTITRALHYIKENAKWPIEVTDVAMHLNISRRSLEIQFAKHLNTTPAAQIRKNRIEKAKKLLLDTQDSITNIVYASGFNSRQVFCSTFKKEVGLTPTQFRKNKK